MSNRPNTFFKYMTTKVASVVLVNHTLRWSSPLLFNDPFDVTRDLDFGFNFEELNKELLNEIMNLISADDIPDLSSRPRIAQMVNQLRRNDSEHNKIIPMLPQLIEDGGQRTKSMVNKAKTQWSKFIPEFRILCLSSTKDNLAMWSHYSDLHKGVVLELQVVDHLDSPWLMAQPVVYHDSPPVLATKQEWVKSITGEKPLDHNNWRFYEPLTITKTKDWEYEKEWRVVSFMRSCDSGLYTDYPFNPPELRAIYLGCEISDEDADDVISLINYDLSHVHIYRTEKHEHDRKLIFQKIK